MPAGFMKRNPGELVPLPLTSDSTVPSRSEADLPVTRTRTLSKSVSDVARAVSSAATDESRKLWKRFAPLASPIDWSSV